MDIEKAKKLLNGIDIKFFLNGTIEQSNYIVDKADEINLAIEAVLNKLEKKDKELKEAQKETMQIYSDYQDIGKIAFDLDEKVQKLIKKLEEEKYTIESTYSQINGNYFMAQDKLDLIDEILSILKGEKE